MIGIKKERETVKADTIYRYMIRYRCACKHTFYLPAPEGHFKKFRSKKTVKCKHCHEKKARKQKVIKKPVPEQE